MYKYVTTAAVLTCLVMPPLALAAECRLQPATLTGYFTPIASEYTNPTNTLLPWDFLKLFVVQWMGITERWGVIGLWDSDGDGQVNVHINLPCPLDARGDCLVAYNDSQSDVPGTAASNTLPPGTLLRIGGPAGNLYKITDTIGVTNGHDEDLLIDLYFGEGEQAHDKAKENVKLDGSGQVCVY